MPKKVQFSASDTLKVILTTQEDKKAKKPHQTFLLVKDDTTGLETSFPFSLKDSGKGKVELVKCTTSHWPASTADTFVVDPQRPA